MIATNTYSLFKTPHDRARYMAAYDTALSLWSVPCKEIDLPTRLGSTHVIAAGDPSDPPLILLHGAGNSATMWYPIISQLSAHYRTYALDTIGDGGKSILSQTLKKRADYAGWLEDVLDGLRVEEAYVAGLSYGGWLSLNLALCAPRRVKKLALLAPAASFQKFSWMVELFFRIVVHLPFQPSAESIVRQLTTKDTRVDPRYIAVLGAVTRNVKPSMLYPDVYTDQELQTVNTPTLLIYGDQEVIYNPHKAADRARRCMPNVEISMITGANHFLPMDQPAHVADCLLGFFGR